MEKLRVSELNRYVKLLLETNGALSGIRVTGEISNFTVNRFSGHAYFSLKDETALVRAVCFKSAAATLRFVPKDGMLVTVAGRVSLYERDGQFQFIVDDILPEGAGTQNRLFEQLRAKLEQEGLFARERKRPLALYPKTIAVVAAPGSAALGDIIRVVSRRCPITKLTVFPALVQGLQAEASVADAIDEIGRAGGFDTVIIARGGGSKEDLYTFNSEAVVRAAAALPVPFISAVGHESDLSLLDLAADVRASTPSAAAELAVPDLSDTAVRIAHYKRVITQSAGAALSGYSGLLSDCLNRLTSGIDRRIGDCAVSAAGASKKALSAMEGRRERQRAAVQAIAERLHALDPMLTFARGYAYIEKEGLPVAGAWRLKEGDAISLHLTDGSAECTVDSVRLTGEERWNRVLNPR